MVLGGVSAPGRAAGVLGDLRLRSLGPFLRTASRPEEAPRRPENAMSRPAEDQVGTLRSISRPVTPAAISRRAVTVGLSLLSRRGSWPCASSRARYVAARVRLKRLGICARQSSTVMRAIFLPMD